MEEIIELDYRRPQPPVSLLEQKVNQIKADPDPQSRLAKLEKLKLEVMAANPTGLMVPAPGYYFVENQPVSIDPANFNPRKGIMTRYGKKLLEQGAKYYGKVNISNGSS